MTKGLALITGGAVRLGRAITESLANAGYTPIIHARSHAVEARALAEKLGGHAIIADLADRAAIHAMFDRVAQLDGPLKVLVNNAGIFDGAPSDEVTEENWDRHLAINLTAPWLCCQRAAPLLRETGGCIVNLLDISATKPYRNYVHYSASKAGLLAITQGLAAEWAPEIRVNGVSPGAALMPEWYSEEQREKRLAKIPMAAEPGAEAIAETVRFLVDGPSAVTGQVIAVDGGRSVRW